MAGSSGLAELKFCRDGWCIEMRIQARGRVAGGGLDFCMFDVPGAAVWVCQPHCKLSHRVEVTVLVVHGVYIGGDILPRQFYNFFFFFGFCSRFSSFRPIIILIIFFFTNVQEDLGCLDEI